MLGTTFADECGILHAVGLLHPDMTEFELLQYGLAYTIQRDEVVYHRLIERCELQEEIASLPPGACPKGHLIVTTHPADYVDAIKSLTPADLAELRERVLNSGNWQAWAASRRNL